MLGKSGVASLVVAALALVSCAHNVPQDKATGPDGKYKEAKAITLENGEGRASGIVTYPGGDRVDWKSVELPEKKTGTLELKLSWFPPRPGLQLGFDVFDQWGHRVGGSKRVKSGSRSRVRTASIDGAEGKYLIRVYAVSRGDAGKYKLALEFKEGGGPISVDLTKVEIPDPPRLAAVPEPEATCDEFSFDMKNPACRSVCGPGAPANWPGCAGKCPTPPDPQNEACWDKVCPNPPTSRSKACMKNINVFPACDFSHPDPDNPKCNVKAEPIVAQILSTKVEGREVLITIAAGTESKSPVQSGWTGVVLRGNSDTPIDGSNFTVSRVGKKQCIGRVKLTVDKLASNSRVRLSPP